MAEGADMAALYIVIWLEHHGNRLYGVMGSKSRVTGWMGDSARLQEHLWCSKFVTHHFVYGVREAPSEP